MHGKLLKDDETKDLMFTKAITINITGDTAYSVSEKRYLTEGLSMFTKGRCFVSKILKTSCKTSLGWLCEENNSFRIKSVVFDKKSSKWYREIQIEYEGSIGLYEGIKNSCMKGNISMIEFLIERIEKKLKKKEEEKEDKMMIIKGVREGFEECCKEGYLKIAELLYNFHKKMEGLIEGLTIIDVGSFQKGLGNTVYNKNESLGIIKFFIKNTVKGKVEFPSDIFQRCCYEGKSLAMIKEFLHHRFDERFNVCKDYNNALKILMLNRKKESVNADGERACNEGLFIKNVIKELLDDSRVDVSYNDNFVLYNASQRGLFGVVELLLGQQNVIESYNEREFYRKFKISEKFTTMIQAVMVCIQYGYSKLLTLLLDNSTHFNEPFEINMETIVYAMDQGNKKVVLAILKYKNNTDYEHFSAEYEDSLVKKVGKTNYKNYINKHVECNNLLLFYYRELKYYLSIKTLGFNHLFDRIDKKIESDEDEKIVKDIKKVNLILKNVRYYLNQIIKMEFIRDTHALIMEIRKGKSYEFIREQFYKIFTKKEKNVIDVKPFLKIFKDVNKYIVIPRQFKSFRGFKRGNMPSNKPRKTFTFKPKLSNDFQIKDDSMKASECEDLPSSKKKILNSSKLKNIAKNLYKALVSTYKSKIRESVDQLIIKYLLCPFNLDIDDPNQMGIKFIEELSLCYCGFDKKLKNMILIDEDSKKADRKIISSIRNLTVFRKIFYPLLRKKIQNYFMKGKEFKIKEKEVAILKEENITLTTVLKDFRNIEKDFKERIGVDITSKTKEVLFEEINILIELERKLDRLSSSQNELYLTIVSALKPRIIKFKSQITKIKEKMNRFYNDLEQNSTRKFQKVTSADDLKQMILNVESNSSEDVFNIDVADIDLKNTTSIYISTGAQGSVYRTDYKGNTVAIKICKFSCDIKSVDAIESNISEIASELRVLKDLKQKLFNIIFYHGTSISIDKNGEGKIIFVMEYCKYNLKQFLEAKKPYSLIGKMKMIYRMARTFQSLHDKYNFCHRDFKMENVMVDSDDNCKLIDFGSCTTDTRSKGQPVGTVQYM